MTLAFPEVHTPRHVSYADPEVGGGKTHSLEHFAAHPFTGKGIIAIQSIQLATEIEAELIDKGASVLRIDTDAFPYKDGELTCTEILNDALKAGEHHFLICNHEVALRANPQYAKQFDAYFDEVPPIYKRHFLDGAVQSHNMVSSLFTSLPLPKKQAETDPLAAGKKKTEWRQIIATDAGVSFLETNKLEKLVKADGKVYEAVQKANDTDNYIMYGDAHINENFRLGREGSLVLHSIMKPAVFDKFRSVTVLGAHFSWSLMYKIWKEFHCVEFSLHEQIMTVGPEGIRYQDLKHKAATTKVYCITDQNCSKTLYNKIDYQPTFDATHDAFKALMKSEQLSEDTKHLVFLNNKPKEVRKAFQWKDKENGIVLSSAARGWDSYKDVDVAIFLAACNEQPDTYQLLHDIYGLNHDAVDRATCLERAYQAVGRSSWRDMDSDRTVYLIFFDYRAAAFAVEVLGCGKPLFLDTGIEELAPKTKQTDDVRQKRTRHNKMIEELADIPAYEGFRRRVWTSKKCFNPSTKRVWDWQEWVLTSYAQATSYVPEDKDSAKMYKEGDFKSANHKTKGNINGAKIITLDFDHVTGDPYELCEHFHKQGFSFVLMNSNSSRDGAWRFRVDIALSQPVSFYAYGHIANWVVYDIQAKFGRTTFVDDVNVRHGHAKFYVPGLAVHDDGNQFIDGTLLDDAGEPVFLDVMAYMQRDPIEKELTVVDRDVEIVTYVVPRRSGHATMTVEEVLAKRACPAGVQLGRTNYWDAAVDLLYKVKLTREEAINVLHVHRHLFGSAHKRNAEEVVDLVLATKQLAA